MLAPITLIFAAIAFGTPIAAVTQKEPIELRWWHVMTGVNDAAIKRLSDEFNRSQRRYRVTPVFNSRYAQIMNGMTVFRAGSAPHILQVFEVGTATMMSNKAAIKPVHELMVEAGEPFDPDAFLPAVTAYYSTRDGKMLSMPFNTSTAIMWYNKDAFRKAGLDPSNPPATWPETIEAAKKIRAAGYPCGLSAAWGAWTLIEQFSAWHNLALATKGNGMDGLDAELKTNSPLHVRMIRALADLTKDGTFVYGGRTNSGESKFTSGECAIFLDSSAFLGKVQAEAKFDHGTAKLPYWPDVAGAPQNSIVGGASLWVMRGKSAEEYKGVARFFAFISAADRQMWLHTTTGYLPITRAALKKTRASGFYAANPGRDVPILQMVEKAPTSNSRGLRLGSLTQIRDVWAEELEAAFSGAKTAQAAMDAAVERGNRILRQFESEHGNR